MLTAQFIAIFIMRDIHLVIDGIQTRSIAFYQAVCATYQSRCSSMKAKSAMLGAALVFFSWSPLHSQVIAPPPLTVPPASACASGAQNFGVIASYLNNGNMYKSTVLAPAISKSTTFPEFEYYLGQALAIEQQQLDFLNACKFGATPFCQPGDEKLADTTPAEVASLLEAFDADEGLIAIQGFFSIPTPPTNFNATSALNSFFIVTEGSVCLLHPYLVHPAVVKGLKPPKLT